jgi:hypothetical protein
MGRDDRAGSTTPADIERRAMLEVSRIIAQFLPATDDPDHPVQQELGEAHQQLRDVARRLRHQGLAWSDVLTKVIDACHDLRLPTLDTLRAANDLGPFGPSVP